MVERLPAFGRGAQGDAELGPQGGLPDELGEPPGAEGRLLGVVRATEGGGLGARSGDPPRPPRG